MSLFKKKLFALLVLMFPMVVFAGGIKGPIFPEWLIFVVVVILLVFLFFYFYSMVLAARAYRKNNKSLAVISAFIGSLGLLIVVLSASGSYSEEMFAAAFFVTLIPCVVTISYLVGTFRKVDSDEEKIVSEYPKNTEDETE